MGEFILKYLPKIAILISGPWSIDPFFQLSQVVYTCTIERLYLAG